MLAQLEARMEEQVAAYLERMHEVSQSSVACKLAALVGFVEDVRCRCCCLSAAAANNSARAVHG